MWVLAHRSAGPQRLPIVDYLVAAAAQELVLWLLHDHRDDHRLAEVMEFESVWLVLAGTLPERAW